MSGAGFAGALTAGDEYPRRPADWCHNGHPFRPGTTVDNDPPSDDWCGVCGEARRPASGGVPVEALRAILDDPYGGPIRVGNGTREHSHAEPVCAFPDCIFHFPQAEMALERLRALLDSATTDGGERS